MPGTATASPFSPSGVEVPGIRFGTNTGRVMSGNWSEPKVCVRDVPGRKKKPASMPHDPQSSNHVPARRRNPLRVLSRSEPGPMIAVVPGSPRKPLSAVFGLVVASTGVANPGIHHRRYSPRTKYRFASPPAAPPSPSPAIVISFWPRPCWIRSRNGG